MNLEEFAKFYSRTNQAALEARLPTMQGDPESEENKKIKEKYNKETIEIFNSEKTVKEFEDARRNDKNRTDGRTGKRDQS